MLTLDKLMLVLEKSDAVKHRFSMGRYIAGGKSS